MPTYNQCQIFVFLHGGLYLGMVIHVEKPTSPVRPCSGTKVAAPGCIGFGVFGSTGVPQLMQNYLYRLVAPLRTLYTSRKRYLSSRPQLAQNARPSPASPQDEHTSGRYPALCTQFRAESSTLRQFVSAVIKHIHFTLFPDFEGLCASRILRCVFSSPPFSYYSSSFSHLYLHV